MMNIKRKMTILLSGSLLLLSLTGCAENQIPDLSEGQIQEVKNYVAATMMKYQMGRKSRLVDLSKYSELEAAPGVVNDEPKGMAPVDDTPVIDSSGAGQSGNSGQSGSSGGGSVSYRMEDIMELPEGMTVTFQGYQICDSYPEDENEVFYMGASQGKKLLVLSFNLVNAGSQEQTVDMMFPEVIFHITVNGEYTRRALTTGLLNDMSTFEGTLPGGGSTEAVLVIEVNTDMEGNLSSIDLGVQKEKNVYHFQLL